MIKEKYIRKLTVSPGRKVSLKRFDTGWAQDDELKNVGKDALKERAAEILEANRAALAESQELLWASNLYSLLIVLQGMDTSGKDGTIRHVMAGVNPQGCRVTRLQGSHVRRDRSQFPLAVLPCASRTGRDRDLQPLLL